MRKLFCISLIGLISLFVFSCKKNQQPVSDAAPVISFANFTTTDARHAVFTFNFSDADGNRNIGLQQSDTSGNFAPGTVGYNDFYMRYYYKNSAGNFVKCFIPYPGLSIHSNDDSCIIADRIPYMDINIKSQAISGQIIINLNGYKPTGADSFNHFRYEFWIYDRNMRKSNVVTTPEFDTPY